jgi:hypothetical protein
MLTTSWNLFLNMVISEIIYLLKIWWLWCIFFTRILSMTHTGIFFCR